MSFKESKVRKPSKAGSKASNHELDRSKARILASLEVAIEYYILENFPQN